MSIIQKLFPIETVLHTIQRFFLSVICSISLFALIVLEIHDIIDWDDEIFAQMAALSASSFFWFVVARVFKECENLEKSKHILLNIAGFLSLALVMLLSKQWALYWIFLMPTLLLLLMVCPYLKRSDDFSFWFFNKSVWLGALMAIMSGIVLGGGLTIAMLSIDYLFNLDMDNDTVKDIWAFSLSLFTPLYALSFIPKAFQTKKRRLHFSSGPVFSNQLDFGAAWHSVFGYSLCLFR